MADSALVDLLRSNARHKGIVVLAGTGVSSLAPAAIPGWRQLNEMIAGALCDRIDSDPGRPERLASGSLLRSLIEGPRPGEGEGPQFPPEYQAQVLEEACGARYFQALQSVRAVTTPNAAHRRIAWLARHGVVRAVVTTGIDRLVELALEEQRVPHVAAFDAMGFEGRERLAPGTVPILKVRGCVSDQLSLADTLKRRLLGRNDDLHRWLGALLREHHWVLVGCAADDSLSGPDPLRLLAGAPACPGVTVVRAPNAGARARAAGASLERALLETCAGKAEQMIAPPDQFFATLGQSLGVPSLDHGFGEPPEVPPPPAADVRPGQDLVREELAVWAGALGPIAAVNCLASLLEVHGASVAAFRLLHAYRDDPRDRDGKDAGHLWLNHGRLGMGRGLLGLADEGWGAASHEDTFADLWRHGYLAGDPRSLAWGGLALLWRGQTSRAFGLLKEAGAFLDAPSGLTPEEKADVCFAQGEAFYILGQPEPFMGSWTRFMHLAGRAGDLPRQAGLAALATLFHAEFAAESFPAAVHGPWKEVLVRAERLRDPTIQGFVRLADARHAVRSRDGETALLMLEIASQSFTDAARPAWCLFAAIERVKALLDLARVDEAQAAATEVEEEVARHPIWLPWFHEAAGQLNLCLRKKDEARDSFVRAVECAAKLGLDRRAKALRSYLRLIQS